MISQQHTPAKFKSRHLIPKALVKLTPAIQHILEKLTILIIPLPLFMLITGIAGIIEQESPESLASIGAIGSGFFNSFDMHFLIILGAFGVTFIIWFLTRNIWNNRRDNSIEKKTH